MIAEGVADPVSHCLSVMPFTVSKRCIGCQDFGSVCEGVFVTLNHIFHQSTSSTTWVGADASYDGEASSVVTNYKTKIHIAKSARWFGHGMTTVLNTRG